MIPAPPFRKEKAASLGICSILKISKVARKNFFEYIAYMKSYNKYQTYRNFWPLGS